jgi:hypothetical protein
MDSVLGHNLSAVLALYCTTSTEQVQVPVGATIFMDTATPPFSKNILQQHQILEIISTYPNHTYISSTKHLLTISQDIKKQKHTLLKWAPDRPIYQQACFIKNNNNGESMF